HPQQVALPPLEHAFPDHVGRKRAGEQHACRRGGNAESGHPSTEDLLVNRRGEAIDNPKEPDERGDGDEQRNGDEEAGDEAAPEPLHHRCPQWTAASSATPVMMRYHPKSAKPCRRTMFKNGFTTRIDAMNAMTNPTAIVERRSGVISWRSFSALCAKAAAS